MNTMRRIQTILLLLALTLPLLTGGVSVASKASCLSGQAGDGMRAASMNGHAMHHGGSAMAGLMSPDLCPDSQAPQGLTAKTVPAVPMNDSAGHNDLCCTLNACTANGAAVLNVISPLAYLAARNRGAAALDDSAFPLVYLGGLLRPPRS